MQKNYLHEKNVFEEISMHGCKQFRKLKRFMRVPSTGSNEHVALYGLVHTCYLGPVAGENENEP